MSVVAVRRPALKVGDWIEVEDFGRTKYQLPVIGVHRYRRRHGTKNRLPHAVPIVNDDVLKVIAGDINFRTKHHYDNVFLVTGEERTGKSHTAIRLAMELDPTFDESRIIFDVHEELDDALLTLSEPGRVVIIDEAGREINARSWSKREQRELVTKFQVFGKLGMTVILVMPRMSYLDSAIRDTRLKFWLRVMAKNNGKDRGFVFWSQAQRNDYDNDTWWAHRIAGKLRDPNKIPEVAAMIEKYERKKDRYIMEMLGTSQENDEDISTGLRNQARKNRDERDKLIWYLMKIGASAAELHTLTGLSRQTVYDARLKAEEKIDKNTRYMLGLSDEVET